MVERKGQISAKRLTRAAMNVIELKSGGASAALAAVIVD